jgi:hypothetical protein
MTIIKATFGLLLAVVLAGALAVSGSASARSGELHVLKDCAENQGRAGDHCTIQWSSLNAIDRGMQVVYLSAAGATGLDSDIVLDGPGNNDANGHVTLDFQTLTGVVTFSGGTGRFQGFHARVDVTHVSGTLWRWDGTYSFTPPGHDR